MMSGGLRRDTRGGTAVEFAVVGTMLCLTTFAIVEAGLLYWMKSGMQAAASMGARCGSIGYTYNTANFQCTNAATTQSYTVNAAQTWLLQNVIVASEVTVNGRVSGTTCNAVNTPPGNYFSVSITHTVPNLPSPLAAYSTLTASACYPMQ